MNADFSVDSRVGYAPFTVIFTDSSTGPGIISRTWDFGDGYTYTGTDTTVSYTYEESGIYTVSLTVEDGSTEDTEEKENYVAVNYTIPIPSAVVAKSNSNGEGRYWNFYIDQDGHLVFENEIVTHRSLNKIADIDKWTFVQYNPGSNKMYAGDPDNFIREIDMISMITSSPETPSKKRLFVALNSSFSIDELRIWYGEQDLTEYFRSLWGRAAYLS